MKQKRIPAADFFTAVKKTKVIPVLKFETEEEALNTVSALCRGGILIAEITYRTNAASSCIQAVAREIPEVIVGAGTVTDVKTAKDAISNGAQFIVMPGYDEATVRFCMKKNVPVIPGVATPSEIIKAAHQGLSVLKLFPAEVLGGVPLLKSLQGPFPGIQFIPTGGITSGNAQEYLTLQNVAAVGGSWLADSAAVKNCRWNDITDEAKKIRGL